jgi:hypothetical protein
MPNNFPAPTEIVASDPRFLWYWNQAAAEMDRRGVNRWLGHGQRVGDEHYTMSTDDLFDRASDPIPKSAAESAAVSSRNGPKSDASEKTEDSSENPETKKDAGIRALSEENAVVGGGLEPPTHGFSVHCSTN